MYIFSISHKTRQRVGKHFDHFQFSANEPTQQPSKSPTTAQPTNPTPAPTIDPNGCDHRHRKSWSSLSNTERQLYIDGFKKLNDRGITQEFTKTHLNSSEHGNS